MPPKIDLSEMLFDGEADTEVMRLAANKHLIRDRDYFERTSDRIAAGYDPATRKRLTMSGLQAWVARCEGQDLKANLNDPSHHPSQQEAAH